MLFREPQKWSMTLNWTFMVRIIHERNDAKMPKGEKSALLRKAKERAGDEQPDRRRWRHLDLDSN